MHDIENLKKKLKISNKYQKPKIKIKDFNVVFVRNYRNKINLFERRIKK